ncbi:phosphotransferase enzyme family protein [Bacillus testis]|uniref:phosphotransferase enzyme family protein n=1 Tax=Bacillus testis TaxID=1622072 RepID=UPI00067EF6CE|nr:phosphotransferase [Bacillus testis]
MEKEVDVLFEASFPEEAALRFGIAPESLASLGDYESYIFAGDRNGLPVILRISHSSHKSVSQLLAEVDFVAYLKNNGVRTYNQYTSTAGQFVETIPAGDGSEFYAMVYEKLPGKEVKGSDIKGNEALVNEWGRTIGKMNALSGFYSPSAGIEKRLGWQEEELLDFTAYGEQVPASFQKYSDHVVKQLLNLPVNEGNYGLIHSDLHQRNFLFDHGKLNVFDFDDCSYHWFASDIAIPLYYSLLQQPTEDKDEYAQWFMKHFLQGYRKEKEIGKEELESIPLFLRLRDLTLLSSMYKKFDLGNMDSGQERLFKNVYKRVKSEQLLTSIHFSKF